MTNPNGDEMKRIGVTVGVLALAACAANAQAGRSLFDGQSLEGW